MSAAGVVKVQSQQDFLLDAKSALGLTWDEMAVAAGIEPRAFKNYRMPDSSQNHRGLPRLARRSIEQLLSNRRKKKSEKQP